MCDLHVPNFILPLNFNIYLFLFPGNIVKCKYFTSSGSFQFLSPLSTTFTADSITVTWTPPKLSPTGYQLNTVCSWPCNDDTALPHTTSTPGPADTSATITGLLPGSMCTITLTALYDDIVSDTMTTQSETPAQGSNIYITKT